MGDIDTFCRQWICSGGRVVPLLYDWSDSELAEAFDAVNGILFTGGGVDIARQSNAEAKQYLHAASVLFNLTLTSSDWVPLWGTCLGLQTLSVLGAGGDGHGRPFKPWCNMV